MKLSDVIALIGAGYSKEEIEALEKMDANGAPDVETHSDPTPEQKPAPQPEQKPEQPDSGNAELLAAIKDLKAAVQAGNIRHSQQPEADTAKTVAEAADKALLEMYNI